MGATFVFSVLSWAWPAMVQLVFSLAIAGSVYRIIKEHFVLL